MTTMARPNDQTTRSLAQFLVLQWMDMDEIARGEVRKDVVSLSKQIREGVPRGDFISGLLLFAEMAIEDMAGLSRWMMRQVQPGKIVDTKVEARQNESP